MNILAVYVQDEDTEKVIDSIAHSGARTFIMGIGTEHQQRMDEAEAAYREAAGPHDPDWDDLGAIAQASFAWQRDDQDQTDPIPA